MKRIFAHLVLLVTLWGCAAPALLGPSEADLPACCRGRGKHHCAMMDMAREAARRSDGSPAFGTHSAPCPYRHLGSVFNRCPLATARQALSFTELSATNLLPLRDLVRRASALPIRTSGRSPPLIPL